MVQEKITRLFDLLGCTNVEIAEHAGCDRSYISHIRRGDRKLKPKSRTVARLVGGIYSYADSRNILPLLCELTDADDDSRDILIPEVIAWLFDREPEPMPAVKPLPRQDRKTDREAGRKTFGNRLDAVMRLLNLRNARLARDINVDNSLISRFRNGLRSPRNNRSMSEQLVKALIHRAHEQNQAEELASMSHVPIELFTAEPEGIRLFANWLFDAGHKSEVAMVDNLLESIDSFAPFTDLLAGAEEPRIEPGEPKDVYWGNEGLREAVYRFLADAAATGGKLYLYSDEAMDWLSGDREFFRNWSALMINCLKHGVRMKIVHNVDRGTDEMLEAIRGWMPLYMSGLIEPWVCRQQRNERFARTMFLQPGRAAIHGTHTSAGESFKWYNYITDPAKLESLENQFEALVDSSESVLKIFVGKEESRMFRHISASYRGNAKGLYSEMSLGTMPEALLNRMVDSQIEDEALKQSIRTAYKYRREQFLENVANSEIYEFVRMPSADEWKERRVYVNMRTEISAVDLLYSEDNYREHLQAVIRLLEENVNYHLVLMPEVPFPDMQIALQEDSFAIFRSKPPFAAFLVSDPLLVRAMKVYFELLAEEYGTDRSETREQLRRLIAEAHA